MVQGSTLKGRVAVVTGGGRGIGEGIARSLAGAGSAVVLGARSSDQIDAVAGSIRADGGRALAVKTDVTDLFALGSLATAAVEEFGHLDIWVNNAGGTTVSRPLTELTRREWDDCVALNFTAVWDGAMAAVEQMRWGSIVNISSLAAFGPVRGAGHYSACKAAVNSLTQTMAHELAPDIRVNGIAPGPVPTSHFFENIESKEYSLDALTERIPLGLGTPRDIGDAVVYLSSDAARWVTGQTLMVSGGLTLF
jgi:NAD(P)-dependent dehydrogenase (short-subunit alcohol dehydrogenase family)